MDQLSVGVLVSSKVPAIALMFLMVSLGTYGLRNARLISDAIHRRDPLTDQQPVPDQARLVQLASVIAILTGIGGAIATLLG